MAMPRSSRQARFIRTMLLATTGAAVAIGTVRAVTTHPRNSRPLAPPPPLAPVIDVRERLVQKDLPMFDAMSKTRQPPQATYTQLTPESTSEGLAPRWMHPTVSGECPPGHPIKARFKSGRYYLPEDRGYKRARIDCCYATTEDAEADGFVHSRWRS